MNDVNVTYFDGFRVEHKKFIGKKNITIAITYIPTTYILPTNMNIILK